MVGEVWSVEVTCTMAVAINCGHIRWPLHLERGAGQTRIRIRRRTDRRIFSAGDTVNNLPINLESELLRPVTTLAVTAIGYLG